MKRLLCAIALSSLFLVVPTVQADEDCDDVSLGCLVEAIDALPRCVKIRPGGDDWRYYLLNTIEDPPFGATYVAAWVIKESGVMYQGDCIGLDEYTCTIVVVDGDTWHLAWTGNNEATGTGTYHGVPMLIVGACSPDAASIGDWATGGDILYGTSLQ